MILTRNSVHQLLSNQEVLNAFPKLRVFADEVKKASPESFSGCRPCAQKSTDSFSLNAFLQKSLSTIENSTQEQLDLLKKILRDSTLYVYANNEKGETVLKKLGN
jgi:hypothetical protein